jgi:excisionase family DNA binding protein
VHYGRMIAAEASVAPAAPKADDWPPLLIPAEVAGLFRVDTATVYRWAKTGALASVRVGRCVRIRSDSVRALLEAA